MTEYLLKKQGEGSLQAAVSGYGKLEIQSKTQTDLGQIDRLDLLKKFVRTNFLALAVAHSKPRSLQPVMGQALPWGKLWTTASREEVSHKPCKPAVENLRPT